MLPAFGVGVAPSQSTTFLGTRTHALVCERPSRSRTTPASARQHITWVAKRDGALPSRPGAKKYTVTVRDPANNAVHTVQVPEDRYIWYEMEDAGIDIPASCRNGCCTTCAARIKSGDVEQDEALGLLAETRDAGFALLCVSYPRSDMECTLQNEDQVYDAQFGSSFEKGGIEWGGVMPEEE